MTGGRILVTGATGFTGGHLCRRLIKDGTLVRALVRDENRGAQLRSNGIEVILGDLRDQRSLEHATVGVDVVYHIGAVFRAANVSRKEMWETNVGGTKHMLDAALKAGVQRFVYCSTVGVHGDIKDAPASERAPYAPGDDYQESKTEAEQVVLNYMAGGQLPIVVFRPGGIYGPWDLRFLKLIKAIKRRTFVMIGSGEVLYQMVYIDDLIDGILLCGVQATARDNIYILTGNEPVSLNYLVKLIAEVLGVSPPWLSVPVTPVYLAGLVCETLCKPLHINPPLYRRRVDFFRKSRSFDISKAKRELGFSPKTDLRTGIRLTADWYREHGYL